ncbi:SixA phosphatase family protein [Ignicoccus hospitalis]|uniref:Putative phosphohistidine phosphatase, SixA n=1 Tax=Ignicoccus hospitalis (strain KIN4/I / DSM 18386 / JCM 14125) TaxID=453591 RepID=A8ABV5_IGNH4|nr:histidine phosphatase family protein [Ignicoccus hospitalis]ABU82407.1 putative phosphohistidine phosphatase, SixA [Ignicoccus hospitalis KIN4/I]HIH90882.1 histidine phosphatase family protein [Desulfurococcaceae archaeon]
MIAILFRHGKAVSAQRAGSDEERWLTEEGKEDVRRVAKCLPTPTAIYSSPLRRAKETAEILSEVFNVPYEVKEELSSGKFNLETFAKVFKPGALYVAHNPDLEEVLRGLGCEAKLSAGGAAVVNVGARKLLALLNPEYCP